VRALVILNPIAEPRLSNILFKHAVGMFCFASSSALLKANVEDESETMVGAKLANEGLRPKARDRRRHVDEVVY
jgi:hypothetical protein